MAEIIPAIMPRTLNELENEVERVFRGASTVQVDIMDGAFVREKTWPFIKEDTYFQEILDEKRGLPHWGDINYEIDLMVADPFTSADLWTRAGAARIIFHLRSLKGVDDLKKALEFKNAFVEIGLAIPLDITHEEFKSLKHFEYINEFSVIQCMGIKRIGYQGENLDHKVYENIKYLREFLSDISISVDGGVREDNVRKLVEAGATHLVSGSAILESDNPLEEMRVLERISRIID